jgi:hypothetical protein
MNAKVKLSLSLTKYHAMTTYPLIFKPTQTPIQRLPGALSLGVKQPDRDADHSLPSSVEVKNARSYTSTPLYVFTMWCLVKHRDNFTKPWKRIAEVEVLFHAFLTSMLEGGRATLPPGKDLGTHWIVGWVCRRTGLGAVAKKESLLCRELNPGRPASSPVTKLTELLHPPPFV